MGPHSIFTFSDSCSFKPFSPPSLHPMCMADSTCVCLSWFLNEFPLHSSSCFSECALMKSLAGIAPSLECKTLQLTLSQPQELDFPILAGGRWLVQTQVCSNALGNERFNCSGLLLVSKEKETYPDNLFFLASFFQVFRPRTPPEAIALCSRLLEYTPTARLTPLEACAHSFFDELRDPNVKLPNGRDKPALFNFTTQGSLWALKIAALGRSTDKCLSCRHCSFKSFLKKIKKSPSRTRDINWLCGQPSISERENRDL